MGQLSISYLDDVLAIVEKPAGMLVHRSPIDAHERIFLMQSLRNQLNQHVYPVHRLDKPTSGLVMFALDAVTAREMSQQFERGAVEKIYHAFVRGHVTTNMLIDHPLRDEVTRNGSSIKNGTVREARTQLRALQTWTIPEAVDRYPEARYSRVELKPVTGRYRQLRRHMKHVSHPILGDVRYGKGTHNRFIEQHTTIKRLWLHATELRFRHPVTDDVTAVSASPPDDYRVLTTWLDSYTNTTS